MPESAGVHAPLRQEWTEAPPDLSYRFVISPTTLRAADAVALAVRKKKRRWWQGVLAFLVLLVLRFIFGALILALIGWLSLQAAYLVDRLLGASLRAGSGALLPIMAFLVIFLGLEAGFRSVMRRLAKFASRSLYREFYADVEFLVEGRKSHLWFDERSAGAIRRWSTFEQVVEFEEGMWLFLRRRTTYAGQRGILISKESLPGSCSWSDLQMYVRQRIEEGAMG